MNADEKTHFDAAQADEAQRLRSLRESIELEGKTTLTLDEIFALLDAAMEDRMRASIGEQQTSDWHDQRGELQSAAEYEHYANTHYDEADGIRYAMMEFGMDFDTALEHRDNLWDQLNERYAE